MDTSSLLFLIIRPLHVLIAAIWIGSGIFMGYILMPTIETTGPAGGAVMLGLNRKGLVPFFAAIAGITVLTGIYLFWRFTGGFDPEISRSHAGMAFGVGGVAGILAAIIGGSVVGRSSKQLVEIMTRAMSMPDGAEKAGLMKTAEGLRGRIKSAGNIVIVLQLIALILMAVGHYI
jgi:hypothetical protein